MKSLESYFGDGPIIEAPCRMRLREAHKAHEASRPDTTDQEVDVRDEWDLPDVFPPRSQWRSHRPPRRRGLASEAVGLQALREAIRIGRSRQPDAPWVRRLNELIYRIKSRALSPKGVVFAAPRIVPIPKGGGLEMRPIAIYSVEDRIIQSLTACYLRDFFDAALDPACIAFRSTAGGIRPSQHHETVGDILEFNQHYGCDGQFVAEADLRSFFDCVDHGVARRCVANLVEQVRRIRPDQEIDERALKILEAYLDSYWFVRNVRSVEELLTPPREQQWRPNYSWPSEELSEFHLNLSDARVGVPQGGALSDLLANAVLNEADRAVRVVINNAAAPVFYRRFLDDVILISPDRDACAKCFDTYCATVCSLKLLVHTPVHIPEYGPGYWRTKSKAPFRWAKPQIRGDVPWISFVGYDIRYDGLVRVRRSSIQKHRRRIVEIVGKELARFAARPSEGGAFHRRHTVHGFLRQLRSRLTRMTVGRATIGLSQTKPLPWSWAGGFRGLLHGRILKTQLRDLDRHLERQLRRAERRLGFRRPPSGFAKVTRFHRTVFPGSPYSYAGQFVSSQSQHEDNQHSQ